MTCVSGYNHLCHDSNLNKVQGYGYLRTFATWDSRFNQIHIDIARKFPPSHGITYILTCIDHFICWTETISTTDITDETVAQGNECKNRIFHFCLPSTVTTDTALWNQLIQLLKCKHIMHYSLLLMDLLSIFTIN